MNSHAESLRDLYIVRTNLNQTISALEALAESEPAGSAALPELVGVIPALREQRFKVAAAVEAVMAEREGGTQ